jgi:TrmH family RNA methyltransferase
MISKNKIKHIHSLEFKKFRCLHNSFVAEGGKVVSDLLDSFRCDFLLARPEWINANENINAGEIVECSADDIRKASFLKTPQDVLAVFRLPSYDIINVKPESALVLVLDGVQDPGNVGTIIRLADWFGITHIVCSPDTADAFAPKTIQASMGATARVRIYCADIPEWLSRQPSTVPVYGTFLDGENIYAHPLSENGIIVMGNEGSGIRSATAAHITSRLHIPSYPANRPTTESLNVAIATALTCAEFRRRSR